MERERKNKKVQKGNKKITLKTYLRDFLVFLDKKLIKTVGVLLIISILLIAVSIKPMVATNMIQECEGTCSDGVTLFSEYWNRLQVLLITLVAWIVPYIYSPVVGFIGYVLNEVSTLAYIIKGHGYLMGIGVGIVPLILNVIIICIITALGIYVCNTITIGYRISNIKNMNFLNFRIKLYEVMRNEKKVQILTEKKEQKIKKLEENKEKLNYLQILNVVIVSCILQFISVVIQQIVI